MMQDNFDRSHAFHAPDPRLAGLLDGELLPEERRRLVAHLRVCTSCSADLTQQRLARAALRQAATRLTAPPALHLQIQAALTDAAARSFAQRRRWALLAGGLAAVLALLVAAGLLRASTQMPNRATLTRVVNAHQQQTLGPAPVSLASAEPETVATWAQARTGQQFEIPSLVAGGYHLLGVRLEPDVAAHAITLVYEGAAGRLTCTIVPGADAARPRFALPIFLPPMHATRIQGVGLASWVDEDGAYVMVANLEPAAVLRLARLATQPNP